MSEVNYSDSLATIKSTGFVKDSDLKFLENAISKIQGNWEKQQRFRTNTEMEISVLDDVHYPTKASKYWQCIREQAVQYSELVTGSFEYQRAQLDLEEINENLDSMGNATRKSIEGRRLLIDRKEKEFMIINISATLNDRIRELKMWDGKMSELDDGTFDVNDVNTHQLVSYAKRFEQEMMLLQQNPNGATPGEVQNLVGQFESTRRHLQDLGLVSPTHLDIEANQSLSMEEREVLRQENIEATKQEAFAISQSNNVAKKALITES